MKPIQISKDTSNIIKGLACLLIVAHHFCARLMGKGSTDMIVNFIGLRGGVIGVTIFFFLSAWGLSESQNKNSYSFWMFVKRRLSKVYVPLVITNILYYLFLLFYQQQVFRIPDFLLKTFNLRFVDGVLWFCNTILIFYVIFYVSFIPKTRWGKVITCIVSTLLYSVAATWMFPDAPFYVYSIIGFPIGMICSLYKAELSKLSYWSITSIIAMFFLAAGAFIFPAYKNLFMMNLLSLILLIVIVLSIQKIKMPKSMVILPFIGTYSYEIYLLHNKVLSPLGNAGHTMWFPIAFLLIVIPLAIVLNKLIAKIY